MNKSTTPQRGFALLLALIVASIVLSIGLSLLDVTIKQLSLGATARESEVAFQVAAAGMNCLQYVRNQQLSTTQSAGSQNISFPCLGGTMALSSRVNPSATGGGVVRWFVEETHEWQVGSDEYCMGLELMVLNASGLSSGQVRATPLNGEEKRCAAGDVCTFAFSRGLNRDCDSLDEGGILVQRELTAEF